ncbi:MAG: bacteriocin [Bacteroidota bacterium]
MKNSSKFQPLSKKALKQVKGGTKTTTNKAKMADKAMNAITQYISS